MTRKAKIQWDWMPFWGWIVLAVLVGFVLLPIVLAAYGAWWRLVGPGELIQTTY